MNQIMLIAAVVLCCLVVLRRDWFAPTTVMCVVSLGTMVTIYEMVVLRHVPTGMMHWYMFKIDYTPVAGQVMAFYLGLVALGFFADRLAGAPPATGGRKPMLSEARAGGGPPSAEASSRRTQDRQDERRGRLETRMIGLLCSMPVVALLALLVGACAAHLYQLDTGKLLNYLNYRGLRDADNAGITSHALRFVHHNITMLGCALAPLCALYLKHRRWLPLTLAGLAFGYALMLACAFNSRFFILQLALLTVSFQVLSARRISIAALAMGALTFLAYLAEMAQRRHHNYGMAPFFDTLMYGRLFFLSWPGFIGLTIFGGGFITAEAFTRVGVTYPLAYKVLSFSPLPSAIDHFAAVREYAKVRVIPTVPFSGFAEAYMFGPLYLAALLVIVLVCLVILTRFWRKHRGGIAFIIIAPSYYALFSIHLYQLRSALRWLVLPTVLAIGFELVERYRRRRRGRPAPATGAHPSLASTGPAGSDPHG